MRAKEGPVEGTVDGVTVGRTTDEGFVDGLYTGLRELGNAAVAVGSDVGELLIVAFEQAEEEVAVLKPHVDVLHPVDPPHP